jgi:hypothetical protein
MMTAHHATGQQYTTDQRSLARATSARARQRRGTRLMAAGLLTVAMTLAVAMTTVVTPGAANGEDPGPGIRFTLFAGDFEWADSLSAYGGWWGNRVFVQPWTSPPEVTNTWFWGGSPTWTGPFDGLTYRLLYHAVTKECLSHSSGQLITETCDTADHGQRWATETLNLHCSGMGCLDDVMKPYDQPFMAVTTDDDSYLVLEWRNGNDAVGQRVDLLIRY